jgi:hypothetical protein
MLLKYISIAGRWIFGLWYLITGGAWLVAHAMGRGAAHREVASGAIAFQKAPRTFSEGIVAPLASNSSNVGRNRSKSPIIPCIVSCGLQLSSSAEVISATLRSVCIPGRELASFRASDHAFEYRS